MPQSLWDFLYLCWDEPTSVLCNLWLDFAWATRCLSPFGYCRFLSCACVLCDLAASDLTWRKAKVCSVNSLCAPHQFTKKSTVNLCWSHSCGITSGFAIYLDTDQDGHWQATEMLLSHWQPNKGVSFSFNRSAIKLRVIQCDVFGAIYSLSS